VSIVAAWDLPLKKTYQYTIVSEKVGLLSINVCLRYFLTEYKYLKARESKMEIDIA